MTPREIIASIISQFGPRRAGSVSEQKAQIWVNQFLEQLPGVKTRIIPFKAAIRAKFLSSRIIWPLFWLSLWLYFVNKSYWIAILSSSITAAMFFFHFVSYRHILDFLYRKRKSANVEGILEPLNARNVKNTVIITAHIDSTPEFIWWYRFGSLSATLMVISGALLLSFPVVALIIKILNPYSINFLTPVKIIYGFTGVLGLQFFFIHGNRVVDGAQDNLSGISCILKVMEHFAFNHSLKNTRLVSVSFGSEETGLRGSHNYVKTQTAQFKDSKIWNINLDGILLKDHFNIITAEPSIWIKHSSYLINLLKNSFDELKTPCASGPLLIGATDGASFSRFAFDSVSIVALPLGKIHPTYHTRRDVLAEIDNDCLETLCKVVIRAIEKLDNES